MTAVSTDGGVDELLTINRRIERSLRTQNILLVLVLIEMVALVFAR